MIPSIAVLITCHNRRLKTMECLKHLFLQEGIDSLFSLNIFLVDDGSTDGTAQEVKEKYPNVNIIKGNGELFWNRGMRLAWESARQHKEYDYYLWLNDDTLLFSFAVKKIIENIDSYSIICGTTKSAFSEMLTYGGYKNKVLIKPNGSLQSCDYFNGNIVMIPSTVFEKIGFNDYFFHHALGDFDYGLRASKAGFSLKIAPTVLGNCEAHDSLPKWLDEHIPLLKRFKYLHLPSSGCNPFDYFVFDRRHNGFIKACFHFFTIYLRAIFPRLWDYK